MMKARKLIVRALVVLGFGGAVGLSGGCGANRAQKSRPADGMKEADSLMVVPPDLPVMAMYGVRPAQFDPDKPVRERVDENAEK